jgi:type II secretory pathway component PulL
VNLVATTALFGAVLGGAWASGRAYRNWTTEVNLLTGPRRRVATFRKKYRTRKANALEIGALIGEMLEDIVMAAKDAAEGAIRPK